MPFNLSFQPAQPLVAQAGFQGGVGQYNQFLSNLQLQQQNLQLQNTMNLRGLQEQQYQTQFNAANQQYLQTQQLQTQAAMQARDIASAQYQQQQSLLNQRVMQGNQLSFAGWSQLAQQANQANLAAMQIGAGQWSQQYAAGVNSALSAQNYMQQMGLGDQSFQQSAALQNLQTQNNMQLNAANLQTQADFMPVLSEAAYNAQQQTFANRFQALQSAFNDGMIDQPSYQNAQNQLLAQQVGLRSMMPSQSDMAGQFASQSYTDTATGLRYLYNANSGSFELDPGVQAQLQQQMKNFTQYQQVYTTGLQQMTATQQIINKTATDMLKGMENGSDPAVQQQVFQMVEQQVMGQLKRMMGAGAGAPSLAGG